VLAVTRAREAAANGGASTAGSSSIQLVGNKIVDIRVTPSSHVARRML